MKAEIVAMAVKGILIFNGIGPKTAIRYLRMRGFTPDETVNILYRNYLRMQVGRYILPRVKSSSAELVC